MGDELIDQAFQEALQLKIFSGAQVLLGQGERVLFQKSYGRLSDQSDAVAVTDSTLFDIASLTKPVATSTLIMLAVEEGMMRLDDKIERYLPEFNRPEKLSLSELLAHTSGLPAWLPLYLEVSGKGWTQDQVREFFISQINQTPLEAARGKVRIYSDLGFMLLGFALEEAYSMSLSTLFFTRIAQPLGMTHSLFNPLTHADRIDPKLIAATESCPWRKKVLQGEVHDDNAYALGGIAGHAGLFSTVLDLEKFLLFFLSSWEGRESGCSPATLKKFIGQRLEHKLGWDTVSRSQSQAGRYFSPKTSIGHLAFTGCSLWLDLHDQKHVLLLTNRVHPSRNNEGIKEFRPKIHDLLMEAGHLTSDSQSPKSRE